MFTRTLALRPALFTGKPSWRQRLVQAHALAKSRRALAHLTAEQRADVGLSEPQAKAEAARPFWDAPQDVWDAPAHWRC